MSKRKPTAYWDYIKVEQLLALQSGLEADDSGLSNDEVMFITIHQIDELWFKLILRELIALRDLFAAPKVPEQSLASAVRAMDRVCELLRQVAQHFALMETMTTRDYLGFRDKLSPASGFQSAQMREIEIILGLDDAKRIPLGHEQTYMMALRNADGSPSAASKRVDARLKDTPTIAAAIREWLHRTPIQGSVPGQAGDEANVREFIASYGRVHEAATKSALALARTDALTPTDPAFIYGGTPIIDTSDVFYYGNSQGGIMGGIVMALSQEATRGVLGVPGANYSTLLHRSRDFETYFLVLKANYADDVQRNLTLPLIQQLWDRADPNGWYHHTLPGSLPNTPPHKVLIHMASSDDEVSNLGTEIMVRSMGVPQVSPVVQSYFGIPELAAPFDGSAMVESDGGFPPEPITNIPPADNTAHGDMRARPAIQAQIDQFLRTTGSVQNFCVGPCNPE